MSLLLALCGEVVVGLFFCCDDDNFSLYFAASSNAEQYLFFSMWQPKPRCLWKCMLY